VFGLEILANDIQGASDNRTRFLVVAPHGTAPVGAPADDDTTTRRTTLAFAVRNQPGTLLRALSVFADRGLNLSKLESRPSRTAAWEYVFWVDLDADAADPACAAAFEDLRAVSTMVRVFGSYPRAELA
jgi:chorismate mutase/prephenate dehydratase